MYFVISNNQKLYLCLLLIAYCLLLIAYCLLLIAYCLLLIAYCLLLIGCHSANLKKSFISSDCSPLGRIK
ncbi:hypothetical protein BOQ62_02735 [Chryseobacterium sp. CH21]|nr:hypothetical protein BOQ62_02735 [Chryseobacterium sp. CH21]